MGDEPRLTARELDVMSVLWKQGSGTVSEVRTQVGQALAYTTILWVLQTLEEKGRVRHEKEGRAYRYFPVTAAEEEGSTALGRIMDKVFHGSAAMLLAQLVEERDLPAGELKRMRALLDARLAEQEEK